MSTTLLEKHNLIYVHVPKTAGTSMFVWLSKNTQCSPSFEMGKGGMDHIPYSEFVRLKNLPHGTDYFMVCRNPYEWVFSYFRHNKRHVESRIDKHHPYMNKRERKYYINEHYRSFDRWLVNFDHNDLLYRKLDDGIFNGQHRYVDSNVRPKYILRYETLNEDINKLQEELNISEPLPFLNTSNLAHKKDKNLWKQFYVNDDMVKKVISYYNNDFEYFEYSRNI